VDKFSKWIEAVPVTNQEATTAVKFFESIVYRYGVQNSIITDNGTNFTSGEFQDFAKNLGIKLKYASMAHPKSNGQVEKANGLVCGGLKKRLLRPLKRAAGAWVEELPSVLWSLRTTPNSSMGYTPFFLLFRSEAVLPTDIRYIAPRVVAYVEEDADKALADAQDLLDEARDVALVRSAVYQQSLRNYHSRRVHGRSFEPRTAMGRAVPRPRGHPRRSISPTQPENGKRRRKPMERRAAAPLLSLASKDVSSTPPTM
jgi:transposase InsO family protein